MLLTLLTGAGPQIRVIVLSNLATLQYPQPLIRLKP
jgi:hypothetical protein